ncbi:hypothetical protein FRC10_005672, partial [Ceratobasidium sp. 414]
MSSYHRFATSSTHHSTAGTEVRVLLPRTANDKLLVASAELARCMRPDSAGWVTTAEGKLLVWLPPDLREIDDSLICISPTRTRPRVVIDFSDFVHG